MPTRKFKATPTQPLLPGATERYLNYQQRQQSPNPLFNLWLKFKSRYLERWILLIQSILFLGTGFAVVYVLVIGLYDGPAKRELYSWLAKSPLGPPIQRISQLGEQLTHGSKDIVLRDNMERVRLMVETFPADGHKVYPQNLEQLYQDAKTDNYWNLHKNPLTGSHSKAGIIADYGNYLYSGKKENFAGMVLYERISQSHYRIYGCDNDGKIIQKDGKSFYLSNI